MLLRPTLTCTNGRKKEQYIGKSSPLRLQKLTPMTNSCLTTSMNSKILA